MDDLRRRIEAREATAAVIGLGYVGLPLAIEAARAGFNVVGYDSNPTKAAELAAGRSSISDVADADVAEVLSYGRFVPSADAGVLNRADVFLICVPTPLKHELPDMSFIESAAREISRRMRRETLVVLESTTYPGTTDDMLRTILEANGFSAGEDFFLGFSPERIDPGNERFGLRNVPKIIGGLDEKSAVLMETFYGSFISKTVRVSSPRAAEMTKLMENTYRHINIALANEMAILAHDLEIDIWEVIDAAATKPFGFHAFYPGPGWGGHCIPVDPAYLSWRVRQMGATAHFVDLARQINDRMPAYVVERIGQLLNDEGKSIRSSRILALGMTYKADVADLRESPALQVVHRLLKAGAEVSVNDPFIVDGLVVGDWSLPPTELTEDTVSSSDLVVVLTPHATYDWGWICRRAARIFDTRNALRGQDGNITYL